jgi:hypothetical protein
MSSASSSTDRPASYGRAIGGISAILVYLPPTFSMMVGAIRANTPSLASACRISPLRLGMSRVRHVEFTWGSTQIHGGLDATLVA